MVASLNDPGLMDAFRPRARPDLARAELEGDLAVYDPKAQEMLVLNQSARAIWSCCDGTGTVGEIVADIVAVFTAEPAMVRSQVVELVIDWSRRGLLDQPAPGPLATVAPGPQATGRPSAG
jgi:hypothetical protein